MLSNSEIIRAIVMILVKKGILSATEILECARDMGDKNSLCSLLLVLKEDE